MATSLKVIIKIPGNDSDLHNSKPSSNSACEKQPLSSSDSARFIKSNNNWSRSGGSKSFDECTMLRPQSFSEPGASMQQLSRLNESKKQL